MRSGRQISNRAERELSLLTCRNYHGLAPEPSGMDAIVLSLSPFDLWTLRDALEGLLILGGIGSGKTNGSGRAIRQAMLGRGFGGLVLTAKPNEVDTWLDDCEACGRGDDV